jgi:hypothetical protein
VSRRDQASQRASIQERAKQNWLFGSQAAFLLFADWPDGGEAHTAVVECLAASLYTYNRPQNSKALTKKRERRGKEGKEGKEGMANLFSGLTSFLEKVDSQAARLGAYIMNTS